MKKEKEEPHGAIIFLMVLAFWGVAFLGMSTMYYSNDNPDLSYQPYRTPPETLSQPDLMMFAENIAIQLRIGHHYHRESTWTKAKIIALSKGKTSGERMAAFSGALGKFYVAELDLNSDERALMYKRMDFLRTKAKEHGYPCLVDLLMVLTDPSVRKTVLKP